MRIIKLLGINSVVSGLILLLVLFIGMPLAFFYSEWLPKTLLWTGAQLGFFYYDGARGTLANGWSIKNFHFGDPKQETLAFIANDFALTLSSEWSFKSLWDGTIDWQTREGIEALVSLSAERLEVKRVMIYLPTSQPVPLTHVQPSPFYQLKHFRLPTVDLPFRLTIDSVAVDALTVIPKLAHASDKNETTDDDSHHGVINNIDLQMFQMARMDWSLSSLALGSEWGQWKLIASGKTMHSWPIQVSLELDAELSNAQGAMQKPLDMLNLRLFDSHLSLQLDGSISAYHADLLFTSGVMNNESVMDDLQVSVAMAGGRDSVVVKRAALKGPLGEIETEASLLWTNAQQFRPVLKGYIKTRCQSLDVQPFLSSLMTKLPAVMTELPSPLLAPIDTDFHWNFQMQPLLGKPANAVHRLERESPLDLGHWWIKGEVSQFETRLLSEPVEGLARFRVGSEQGVAMENLSLSWGHQGEWLNVNGSVSSEWDIAGEMSIVANAAPSSEAAEVAQAKHNPLGRVLSAIGLTGKVQTRFKMTGPLKKPSYQSNTRVSDLFWKNKKIYESMDFLITGDPYDLTLDMMLSGGIVDTQFQSTVSLEQVFRQQMLAGQIVQWTIEDPLDALAFNIQKGSPPKNNVNDDRGFWRLRKAVPWKISKQHQNITVETLCFDKRDALICSQAEVLSSDQAQVVLSLERWPLKDIQRFLPSYLTVSGELGAQMTAAWDAQSNNMSLSSKIKLPSAQLDYNRKSNEEFSEEKHDRSQKLTLRNMQINLDYDQRGKKDNSQLYINASGSMNDNGKIMSEFAINPSDRSVKKGLLTVSGMDLSLATPWLVQGQALGGHVDLRTTITGRLNAPNVRSEIGVKALTFSLEEPAIQLREFDLKGSIANQQFILSGEGQFNDGPLSLNVETQWQNKNRIDAIVNLKGHKIYYDLDDQGEVWVSPDLLVKYQNKTIDISGDLYVPRAHIKIPAVANKKISLSRDVVVVDQKTEQQKVVEQWVNQVLMDVKIGLGETVKFNAFGAKGKLEGGLTLTQDQRQILIGNGVVNVQEGQYKAYGQALTIQKGEVLFSGPLTLPRLDIEAIRVASQYNVIAGLRLKGLARTPLVSLFANPIDPLGDVSQLPTSESEILPFLVLGRPTIRTESAKTTNEKQMLTQAALSLGLAKSGIAKKASKILGVKNLDVSTDGSGDDAQLIVGGDLSDRLHLRYAVGLFAPANSIILRYDINQRLYLEALSGLERALDLFYSVDF